MKMNCEEFISLIEQVLEKASKCEELERKIQVLTTKYNTSVRLRQQQQENIEELTRQIDDLKRSNDYKTELLKNINEFSKIMDELKHK